MGKKKVTFSSFVKVVTDNGEIRYDRDWGATPFDFLGQTENLDFIQQQFEQKLSILGLAGKEDLDRLQELSIPFFHCTNNVAQKMGAVEYLRLLAETPMCTPIPSNRDKGRAIMLATLPKIHPNRRTKQQAKKNGPFRNKEIPGRDSPELRKLILMTKSQEPKIFEKYYAAMERPPAKKLTPILKLTKNGLNESPVIDLTYIDPTGLFENEDEENREHWSWEEEFSDERRDQSEDPIVSETTIHDTSARWEHGQSLREPYDPPRQDPPSFTTTENCSVLFDCDAERNFNRRKPDPEDVQIATETCLPSLRYRHVLPSSTSRRGIPAE